MAGQIGEEIHCQLQYLEFLIVPEYEDIEFLGHCHDMQAHMPTNKLLCARLVQ